MTTGTADHHELHRGQREPARPDRRPWFIVYETLVPPAMACTPNSMMRVIPRETITS